MSRRAVVIAVVVALVPALIFTTYRIVDDPDSPGGRTPTTELPIPPVTTPATTPAVTPTSSPTAPATTPAAKPTINTANLPRVAPDSPRRLLSAGLLDVGFDNSVEPSNGTFRAASTDEAARWGSRGTPGNPATDTVYIIGKTYSRGVSAFDTLPELKVGAKVVIRTDNGDLTYTVRTVGNRASAGLARDAGLAAKTPGRLVLVGLRYNGSNDLTGQAVVVTADLTGTIRR